MNWTVAAGILVATLHAALVTYAIVIPFITNNLLLLASAFLIDLFTVILWVAFDNKCFITIIESKLLGGNANSLEHMNMAYFNKILSRWFSPNDVAMFNTLRPYCMMFFVGCKMLPLLAVAAV